MGLHVESFRSATSRSLGTVLDFRSKPAGANLEKVGVRALVAAALWVFPASALAQEIELTGPLRAAPSLRARPLWREDRLGLSMGAGVALGRAGETSATLDVDALYHPADPLGLGVWGALALTTRHPNGPDAGLHGVVGPEIVLVPIKGRLPIPIGHSFDLHLDLGGAWADPKLVAARGPLAMAGAGFCTFFAEFMSLGVDFRALAGTSFQTIDISLAYWPGHRADDFEEEYDDPEP